MIRAGILSPATALLAALALAGCGTPREKTAPCKRPANLSSYAADIRVDCGPMVAVNADRKAALTAIDDLAARSE
jgi:hypothetical protein